MRELREIRVGKDFPMSIGNVIRVSIGSGLLEYFVSKQLKEDGTLWEAEVGRREKGTNKEGVQSRGQKIQRLSSNHFPTPEEIYKRMERD